MIACVAEILLIVLGVYGEAVAHHVVYLIVAAIFAVLLLVGILVSRRLGRI